MGNCGRVYLVADRVKINALLYHDAVQSGDSDASGFPGPDAGRYKLDWDRFREHLGLIERAVGRPPATAHDIVAGQVGANAWSITFDDGGLSATMIAEELARRRWRGQFFVVTSRIGSPGFLSEDGVRALHEMGHVVGSHSHSHPPRLSACSWEQMVHEWRLSVNQLSDLLGARVTLAAVPGGFYSRTVARAASAAGVRTLFTSEPVRAIRSLHGCFIVGRAALLHDASAESAADLARGRQLPWLSRHAAWNVRKVVKTVGGEHYLKLRGALLDQRPR